MTEAVITNISTNRGMRDANEVKIQQTPTGQLIASIPRSLALAYGLKKGDTIVYNIVDGKIVLTKKEVTA